MLDTREKVEANPQPYVPRTQRFLPLFIAIQDAVVIYGSLVLAYWARYKLSLGPEVLHARFPEYQIIALLLVPLMMWTLLAKGAYQNRFGKDPVDDIVAIISAATISVASIIVATYMLHKFEYSRGVIAYLWVFLVILLPACRLVSFGVQSALRRRGWGVKRTLIVGGSNAGKMLMQSIANRPDLGYNVVGFVDHDADSTGRDFGRFRVLGTVTDIPLLIDTLRIDAVILALPASAHEDVWPILTLCERLRVGVKLVPDLFEMSLSQVQVDDIDGIPLLNVQEKPLRQLMRGLKRALDLVIGLIVMTASLPLTAVLALIIRLDSRGPAFIKQERVGLRGRRFACYKLRTMHTDADQMLEGIRHLNETTGPIFKMRNDPRITRIGRYVRRLSLDELPQIWNVVRGDMSLVGPRPPLSREVLKYESWQMRRLEAKPGLTGIWQVSGRSNLLFEEMVMMDIMYVDNWSLSLDIKILLRTFIAVLAARGAY